MFPLMEQHLLATCPCYWPQPCGIGGSFYFQWKFKTETWKDVFHVVVIGLSVFQWHWMLSRIQKKNNSKGDCRKETRVQISSFQYITISSLIYIKQEYKILCESVSNTDFRITGKGTEVQYYANHEELHTCTASIRNVISICTQDASCCSSTRIETTLKAILLTFWKK